MTMTIYTTTIISPKMMSLIWCCLTILQLTFITDVTSRHVISSLGNPTLPCPEGCTCLSMDTVICNGLELNVKLPTNVNPTYNTNKSPEQEKSLHNSDNVNKVYASKTVADVKVPQHAILTSPVHCDCRLALRTNWHHFEPNHLTCDSPVSMRGKSVSEALNELGCSRQSRRSRRDAHDACASVPCHNGGTCITERFGYQCMCKRGYTGINCEKTVTMRDRHLVVQAFPVSYTSIKVTWEFPFDRTTSFEIKYRASGDPEMYMFRSETVQPGTRDYIIQGLRPDTEYHICVCLITDDPQMMDIRKCTDSRTFTHKMDGPRHPPPPRPTKMPVDKKTYEDSKQSNFHEYGMLVFGIAIALCAVAIIVVAVLYRKRLHASRSSASPATQTSSSGDMNDNNIRLRVAMPDDIPRICITNASESQTEPPSSPLAPTAPPNTPTLPSYEEVVSVMSGQTVPFPQIYQPSSKGHQLGGSNNSEHRSESNL